MPNGQLFISNLGQNVEVKIEQALYSFGCSTLWIHFLQIQTGHLVLPGRPQGIHKAAKRIDRVPAIKGSLLTGWNGYYRNGASCAG